VGRRQKAVKRIMEIKNQLRALDKEHKDLETESYVKTRTISESYQTRDQEKIKEFGKRLKEIQSRLREIETLKESLEKEKRSISGGAN
jgi:chromosome segregation ATPase